MPEYPNLPSAPQPEFSSCKRELLSALFSYGLGFLYVEAVFADRPLLLALFAAAFAAVGLFHFPENVKQKEHWVWLGCLLLCLGCSLWGRNRVWGEYTFLFLHAFAIYWIMTLSGKLTDGESSVFLPMDALNGAILLPFSNFFTFFRTRVLFWGIRRLRNGKRIDLTKAAAALLAAAAALCLFLNAGNLLSSADAAFGAFFTTLLPSLNSESLVNFFVKFLLSIPVGAYLYGLIAGAGRLSAEIPQKRKTSILQSLARLRHVPNGVWIGLLACFILLYLLFFGFQARYAFGAFTRTLPQDFTVAEYARQGFFELCRVMVLNFSLLWLILASTVRPVREDRPLLCLCTALLAESLLFAVNALSKLLLYIDCFGFTPLRLQSFWLVCVLLMACILQIISLWTGRKTAKLWILFSGISLSLLHLY
ncbi:MAG: DUF4173 domain-containing protein [Oscillospiraceae bacterium]|nr:DUF4173 domain-containing protein [Oscillospiraceae bacterium]